VDGPIVDSAAGMIYIFGSATTNSTNTNAGVWQFSTGFAAGGLRQLNNAGSAFPRQAPLSLAVRLTTFTSPRPNFSQSHGKSLRLRESWRECHVVSNPDHRQRNWDS